MADDEQAEKKEEVPELAPFDPTKKKKKKKVVIQEPSDEVDNLAEKTESLTVAESSEPSFAPDDQVREDEEEGIVLLPPDTLGKELTEIISMKRGSV
ncbi:eukaryotic translation initiation factor 2 subunit beta-like isoform X2 [Miscanthus floridulus]|uniref:eukaryotic translation initiation factor 2 subunit beta-like isoform X2 n=1 Tax=Miscanthus floridulus TaxID=154761 RepID=UPI003459BB6E